MMLPDDCILWNAEPQRPPEIHGYVLSWNLVTRSTSLSVSGPPMRSPSRVVRGLACAAWARAGEASRLRNDNSNQR
jgi:hypothetical protein